MNANSVARVELLYPRLKAAAYQLSQLLSLKGIDVEVSQGLRTWPQQATLYAQGRTTPGKIVTHAEPGESWHNYGLALDIAIITSGGAADWSGNSPAWQQSIAAGESLGLVSGSEWHGEDIDIPHFQMTGRFPEAPDDEVNAIFAAGGLLAVWYEVDKSFE